MQNKAVAQTVAVVLGSYRPDNMGQRVGKFLEAAFSDRGLHAAVVDPLDRNIPFLDATYAEQKHPSHMLTEVQVVFERANCFVLVSPEYNHLPAPGLLNTLNFFYKEYQHKPCGFVTYSVGDYGGVRGIPALRTLAGALGFVGIAYTLAIQRVGHVLDPDGQTQDVTLLKKRSAFVENLLNLF